MKLLSLKKIADNMILARNVYTREGNVLLAKGTPLKQNYAVKLPDWGVNSVYITDDQGEFVEIDQDLCEMTCESVEQIMADFFRDINSDQLPEVTKKVIQATITQLLTDQNVIYNLVEIKSLHEDIFKHCVTVSILSMIIGSFAGYNHHQLYELAVGAILIDLGKTALLNQFLADPSQLSTTENIELQKHPQLGFDKFHSLKNNYESAAKIILQHHEKFDGSGFPQNLKGEEIHEYARITAIADNFDNFRIKISHDYQSSPNQLLEYLQKNSGSIFDPKFIELFSEKICLFVKEPSELGVDSSTKSEIITRIQANKINNQVEDYVEKAEDRKLGRQNQNVQGEAKKVNSINAEPHSHNLLSVFDKLFSKEQEHIAVQPEQTTIKGNPVLVGPQNSHPISQSQRVENSSQTERTSKKATSKLTRKEKDQLRIREKSQGAGSENKTMVESPVSQIHQHPKLEYKMPVLDFTVTPERCEQTKLESSNIAKKILAKISTDLIPEKILTSTKTTLDELLNDRNIIDNLVMIRALDDNTFSHCITVSLLSVMTGASLGYTLEQLIELGAGSILADLGKVDLSKQFLVDSRSVGSSEYTALMSEHTQFGFERLWELKRGTSAPYIALQHHERYDGSGYPSGLKGDQIHHFSRIVALADTYETLINEGMNGQKLMPHEVIEYIRDFSGSHFDPELSRVFLQNVTPFLIGTNVLLNTGEKAKVIKINKELLARPVIRLMVDKDGKKLEKQYCKDLVEDLTLFIVAALKDDEF